MNPKDAEAAGCDEGQRLLRFRVDRAKGNYSPAQAATWRQLVNVEIANGVALANDKSVNEHRHADQLAEIARAHEEVEKHKERAGQELEEERAKLKAKATEFLRLAGAA